MSIVRGRPRNFNINDALESALHVFWKQGYQGASLAELLEATGLSKPSLYAAFGDKQSLYLKSLERYLALLIEKHAFLLESEADARTAVENFLRSIAKMLSNPKMPGGCFIITGTAHIDGSTVPEEVGSALKKALKANESLLKKRLVQAQKDGHMSKHAEAGSVAALFFTIVAGLAVQAKSGAKNAKLDDIISVAMNAWPA